jgi:hypothetical protein
MNRDRTILVPVASELLGLIRDESLTRPRTDLETFLRTRRGHFKFHWDAGWDALNEIFTRQRPPLRALLGRPLLPGSDTRLKRGGESVPQHLPKRPRARQSPPVYSSSVSSTIKEPGMH